MLVSDINVDNNNNFHNFQLYKTSCLYSSAAAHHRPLAGTHCAYPQRDGQAELTCVKIDFSTPWVVERADGRGHPSQY